jgi:hypothetical protein
MNFSASFPDAEISGGGDAAVLLSYQPDAKILIGSRLDEVGGPVTGPIVNDNDLQIPVSLSQCAGKSLINKIFRIVSRYDDGYQFITLIVHLSTLIIVVSPPWYRSVITGNPIERTSMHNLKYNFIKYLKVNIVSVMV